MLERIKTKPGYKYLAIIAIVVGMYYAYSATSLTVNVDEDGYIYMVNGKYLEMPTKNAELFREANTIVYDVEMN